MATFLESEVARLKLDIEVTNDDIRAFQERLKNPDLTALQRGVAERNLARAQSKLVTLQAELTKAESAVSQQAAPNPQPSPPATAAQTAQDDGNQGPNKPAAQEVNNSGRVVTPPVTTSPTNAEKPTTTDTGGGDTGTDDRTRTLSETQATGPTTPGPIAEPPPSATSEGTAGEAEAQARIAASSPTLATEAGAGAANDDAASNSAESAQVDVNATNTTSIYVRPRANVLDKFFSLNSSAGE
jgi:hypothetical protein